MLYFIKYGYNGSEFTGFQSGNGDKSVEDTIMSSLQKIGVKSPIQSAARTDRGVSAVGNVFSIDLDRNIRSVMAHLNSSCEYMVFHAYAIPKEDISPRHNESKLYRYIVFNTGVSALNQRLKRFIGKHDFSNFARVDHRNTLRSIESITVREQAGYVSVDFRARSFVWHQIRRIMGFVLHEIELDQDIDPFSDHQIRKMAPAEQLILLDISYRGVDFDVFVPRSLIADMKRNAIVAKTKSIVADTTLGQLQSYLNPE